MRISPEALAKNATGVTGCLFHVIDDPSEKTNLALDTSNATAQAMFKKLLARQLEIRETVFAPDRGPMEQAACDKMVANGGFWGPWLDKPTPYTPPSEQ